MATAPPVAQDQPIAAREVQRAYDGRREYNEHGIRYTVVDSQTDHHVSIDLAVKDADAAARAHAAATHRPTYIYTEHDTYTRDRSRVWWTQSKAGGPPHLFVKSSAGTRRVDKLAYTTPKDQAFFVSAALHEEDESIFSLIGSSPYPTDAQRLAIAFTAVAGVTTRLHSKYGPLRLQFTIADGSIGVNKPHAKAHRIADRDGVRCPVEPIPNSSEGN